MTPEGKRPRPRARLEERFLETRDGQRVFVRTWHPREAKGPPLVLLDGVGCQGYAWAYLIDAFKAERPLIYWQYRGHGASPVPDDLDCLTLDTVVDDLHDVLDDAEVERAVFVGHSMGVQVLLEAVRAAPERAAGLVLICGSYERPLDTWHNPPDRDARPTMANRFMQRAFPVLADAFLRFPEQSHRLWRKLIPTRLSYEIATRLEVNGRRIDRRDFWPYLQHVGQMDMRVFTRFAHSLAEHSAADLLPQIKAPTLIIGGGRDTFTPIWLSEEMHRRIPDSEYLCVPDGTHATPVEHPQLLNLRLEKFLRERVDHKR